MTAPVEAALAAAAAALAGGPRLNFEFPRAGVADGARAAALMQQCRGRSRRAREGSATPLRLPPPACGVWAPRWP